MALVDVLLPTCNRTNSLIMTLSGVAAQSLSGLRVVVSDQSERPVLEDPVVQSMIRILGARGIEVEWHRRVPSLGIAEQRQFLLEQSISPAVLYLDDDVWIEPWVVERMMTVLDEQRCGFVGAFPNGLSFKDDVRPEQQVVEFWESLVEPESVEPGTSGWERWNLHRAANLYHASLSMEPHQFRLYKVAWVASCVLYDAAKLREIGGFGFWPRLPRYHSGEEVLVQNILMRRWGGCAMIPSGAWYSEMPSTVLNERGTVDGHALALLDEMVARYAPRTAALCQ